ncbi:hypothetical protein Bca52824_000505 [Brassica carinata]|uniref:Uncharacterized protein n=1 Tax=Brassica carinata TaxID=52824 RepID=A0A8X7WI91_BRACI|nr:hypothetical protein Bca52824_000505 [Brassica carinata]
MVYLEHLKVLDLSRCIELEDIQVIPKNLKKLYLGGTSIQELPSLVHLSELVVLDLENCKQLQKIPLRLSTLTSLAVLNLSGCSELEDMEDINLPRNLEELYLAGTAIQEVPSSITYLSELVILDFQNCKRLRRLPMEISNLKSLVTLKLPRLFTVETGMSNLISDFNENVCQRQDYLPQPRLLPSSRLLHGLVPRFYALVSLSLCNSSLMHIPEEICSLATVTVLDLSRNGFRKIPESIKQLSKLHSLRLRHCRNLRSLPELPQSLKLLNVHGCVSLESVSWGSEHFPSHYTFNNCFNKSPEVARKRVAKGLAKVSSIGKEHEQELIKALAFSICAPADANQTSSYNLRTGSFAMVELTSSLRNTLLGFAIFVVVTFVDDSHNNAGLGVRCISTWKSKRKVISKMEKVFRCWGPREAPDQVQRDHMFVFYEDAEMHRSVGGGEGNESSVLADQVEFEFQAVSGRNKVLGGSSVVSECDVCVMTAATGAASLSVISASKDMSLSRKHSPKLSSLLGKLRFRRTGSLSKQLAFYKSSFAHATRENERGRDRKTYKRVLVVLDDVRKPLDAESFLGELKWFCPGSLIIITSRDKQVPGLNEEEALKLLSRCAFAKDIKHENLQKLLPKVIEYADGNPLALKFFEKGKGESKEVENAFLTFEQTPPHEIQDAVKSTYDSLGSNEKNIFLDIVCLFSGESIDCVMHLLEGCGFFPRVGINVLVEKCLVSISEGKVVMHNLIQDIGRNIISRRKRRSRLWKPSTIKHFLKDKHVLGSKDIEAISVDPSVLSFDLNPMAFEKMYTLRYLKICNSKPGNYYSKLHLPKGLESLPDELRLLHWENFPLSSLPQGYDPRNLVVLNMCSSQLQKLWKGTKELERLKIIKLCHSRQLVDIQELQNARNVEVIDLQGCTRLQRFIDTGHFHHLRVINLSGCTNIKSFPKVPLNIEELYLKQTGIRSIPTVTLSSKDNSFTYDHGGHKFLDVEDSIMVYLEHLKVLDLSRCIELGDIQVIPKNLKKLYLGGTSIQELPSLVHVSELVVLDLENCKQLQKIPLRLSTLTSLAVLNLSGCSELEDIEDLNLPRNLEELYLADTATQEMPSSIRHLSELVILDLQNCKGFYVFPRRSLPWLFTVETSMEINKNVSQRQDYLPEPRLLPSPRLHGLVPRFYAIVSLTLCNASLMHIPEDICSLATVTVLELSRNGFSKIPESIKQLSKLHSLRLRHCRNLRSLPELPQSLKLLNVHGCVSLESVSWASEQFPSHYTFDNCFNKSPEVARKRVAKGLAKVASIGKEHEQELIKALAFSICAPADADQTSSYNLRTGSFAMLELTSSLRNKLLGFAIFVVVRFMDDSDHNSAGLGVRCIGTWKSKRKVISKVEKVFRCWAPREAPEAQRDHMFVFYEDAEMYRSGGGGEGNESNVLADQVEFEFQAVNGRNKVLGGSCMVSECDVCVITAASGAASLSVISASKDMSLSKKQSPKLSSLLGKLRFRRTGRFVGCACLE